MIDTAAREYAAEQLEVLQRADDFARMLGSAGWKRIYALHEEWAERYAKAAKTAATSEPVAAIDALRQWQLAEEFLRLEAMFINSTIEQAADIRGTRTLDEALLMEKVHHEQQSAPESRTADPAGY